MEQGHPTSFHSRWTIRFSRHGLRGAIVAVAAACLLTLAFMGGVLVGGGYHPSTLEAIYRKTRAPVPTSAGVQYRLVQSGKAKEAPRPETSESEAMTFYERLTDREPGLKDQLPVVQGPAPASPAPTAAPPPAASPVTPAASGNGRSYTIQVAAMRQAGAAEALKASLGAKGYDPYLLPPLAGETGGVYRVRIGEFASRKEAEQVATKLREGEGLSPFIVLK